jgi:hypothetical protein
METTAMTTTQASEREVAIYSNGREIQRVFLRETCGTTQLFVGRGEHEREVVICDMEGHGRLVNAWQHLRDMRRHVERIGSSFEKIAEIVKRDDWHGK